MDIFSILNVGLFIPKAPNDRFTYKLGIDKDSLADNLNVKIHLTTTNDHFINKHRLDDQHSFMNKFPATK